MGSYGRRFHLAGERKVTLNFAAPTGYPLDPGALLDHFPPAHFIIKLTPVNPTDKVLRQGLVGRIDPTRRADCHTLVDRFEEAGYTTILSIGELEENRIGSNCGMYVSRLDQAREAIC